MSASTGADHLPGPMVAQRLDEAGVLLLTLNRPERANAWCEELELDYYAAIDRAAEDSWVRVVVLCGAGRHFCPGMDIELIRQITAGTRVYMSGRRPQTMLRDLPKPVIAAVGGACAGIGFVQALMADIRFTAPDARWSTAFGRIGLVAEDGVAWRLQRLCGDAVAADLLLSSRTVDGREAAALGLARLVGDEESVVERALAYARDMAACSPSSLALIKRQLTHDADATLGQSRQLAVELLAVAKSRPDYAEAVAARLERRPANFAGLSAGSVDRIVPARPGSSQDETAGSLIDQLEIKR